MSRLASFVLAAGLIALAVGPAAADSSTTRVETRPFYGATVTLEEGVRVFRPLPATRHMIIAPLGTPVHIMNQDVRVTEERNVNVYNHGGSDARSAPVQGGGYYLPRHGRGGDRGAAQPAGMPAGGVR